MRVTDRISLLGGDGGRSLENRSRGLRQACTLGKWPEMVSEKIHIGQMKEMS